MMEKQGEAKVRHRIWNEHWGLFWAHLVVVYRWVKESNMLPFCIINKDALNTRMQE